MQPLTAPTEHADIALAGDELARRPRPDTRAGRVLAALEVAGACGASGEELAERLHDTAARVRAAISSLRHGFGIAILKRRGCYALVGAQEADELQIEPDGALLFALRMVRRIGLRDLARLLDRPVVELRAAIQSLRERGAAPIEVTPRGDVILHERRRAQPTELLALLRDRGPLPLRTAAALLHVSPATLGRLARDLQAAGRPIHVHDNSLSIAA